MSSNLTNCKISWKTPETDFLFSDRARKFVVDADLARHIRIMDTLLNIVLNYDFLFEHCSHGLQEGDVGEMPKSFVDDQSWIDDTFKVK
ncbi:hypothetical protein Y032_0098g3094 [Ancylostoma ceylanicum]|uniref:Uncharacterized protein n=1 Tax=Ancylostoma ceylanicum TaxID=53326 RepID=A0A016TJ54_9BILA|nr:hypothetical protein Y032_0098g3094 [Ancylostoma ceylanicum]